jgi:hypothetical protein
MTSPREPQFPVHIGQCIYCGAVDGLSDEHIVPHSLGGTLELLKATCERCQKITSQLERHISREHFIAVRTVGQFPTYHPKNRPTELPLTVETHSGSETIPLTPEDHPAPIVLLRLAVPTFLTTGPIPTIPQVLGGKVFARTAKVEKLQRDLGASRFGVPLPDPAVYARFLAKVALGFAVGCVGLDSFHEIFIRAGILGQSEDIAHWVGCVPSESFTKGTVKGELHELVAVRQGTLLQVGVRLFSAFASPEYRIVVGVLHSGSGSSDA